MGPHVTDQQFKVRGPALDNLSLPSSDTQVEANLTGRIAATAAAEVIAVVL